VRRLAALLLAVAPALAAHELVELQCPAEVSYRVCRDLDGDGLADLLVVNGKQAWLWRGRREGPFPRAPDVRMELPPATALFDVGPPGGRPQRLVARTAEGYFALGPDGSEKLPFASGPGLPPAPSNLLWRGFFRDFDGDGETDFLDLSLAGYAITFGGEAGDSVRLPPLLQEKADTRATATSGRAVARWALADWMGGDFTGDGHPDFAVLTPTGLLVYPGDAQGRFDAARSRALPIAEAEDADLLFEDLNGDARMDVIALQRWVGKATVLVADAERGLEDPYRIRLAIPGDLRAPVVADLDSDGRPDLALPYTGRPSVQAGVRAIVRGEAILKVPIFLNRGGRECIGQRADTQFAFPVRLRITTDSAGRLQLGGLLVVEYGGDLDGDGRKDLLVTLTPEELGVHRGRAGVVFEREPSERMTIPDCSDFDAVRTAAADLNGDGSSDIMLQYVGSGRRPDRLFLLLSGKK